MNSSCFTLQLPQMDLEEIASFVKREIAGNGNLHSYQLHLHVIQGGHLVSHEAVCH